MYEMFLIKHSFGKLYDVVWHKSASLQQKYELQLRAMVYGEDNYQTHQKL